MAAIKQISVRQLDGSYLSNPIGADADNVDIDEDTTLADKVSEWDSKVDSETGKGLSTNDYTTKEKEKLAGIASGAEVNVIENIIINGTPQEIVDKNIDLSASFNNKTDLDMVADEYDSSKSYLINDYIIYENKLYKCIEDYEGGDWDIEHFEQTQISKEFGKKDSGGGIFVQTEPPENTNSLWIDISNGDAKGIAKYYINDTWVSVSSVWG